MKINTIAIKIETLNLDEHELKDQVPLHFVFISHGIKQKVQLFPTVFFNKK